MSIYIKPLRYAYQSPHAVQAWRAGPSFSGNEQQKRTAHYPVSGCDSPALMGGDSWSPPERDATASVLGSEGRREGGKRG